MKTLKRTLAAGTAALVVAASGAGAALACDGHHDSTASTMSLTFGVRHAGPNAHFDRGFGNAFGGGAATRTAVVTAVTNYLGLSAAQIKTDLANGQTLAQIATAQQKDPNVLVATIVNAIKPQLDAAVAAHKITSAQETTLLTRLTTKVTALVNQQFTLGGRHHDNDNDGD